MGNPFLEPIQKQPATRNPFLEPIQKQEATNNPFLQPLPSVQEAETGPAMSAYEPSMFERAANWLNPPNPAAASNELVAREIAQEQGVPVDDVYASVGGSRPTIDPQGRAGLASVVQGFGTAGHQAQVASKNATGTYDKGAFDRMGEALPAGWDNMVGSLELGRFALAGGNVGQMAQKLSDKIGQNAQRAQQRTPGEAGVYGALDAVSNSSGLLESIGSGVRAAGEFFGNPGDAAVISAEQAANSVPSLGMGAVGAGAGAVVGGVPGAIVAGRTGMATGTVATEFGAEIEEAIVDHLGVEGVNAPDRAQRIAAILSDPAFMSEAKVRAAKKGLTVAAMDQVFMTLGGKVASKAGAGSKVGAVGLDMAGESVGEATSQLVARGEVDAGDALLEGLAGGPTSIIETGAGYASETYKSSPAYRRQQILKQLEQSVDATDIGGGADAAAVNALRPDVGPEFVDPLNAAGPRNDDGSPIQGGLKTVQPFQTAEMPADGSPVPFVPVPRTQTDEQERPYQPNGSEVEFESVAPQQQPKGAGLSLVDPNSNAIEYAPPAVPSRIDELSSGIDREIKSHVDQQRASRLPSNLPDQRLNNPAYRSELERAIKGLDAQHKNMDSKVVEPKTDDLFSAIAKLGGISKAELEADGFDKADLGNHRLGIRPVFSKKGKSVDDMAEALVERGYLQERDVDGLKEMIRLQLAGNEQFSPAGIEHTMDQAQQVVRAKALGVPPLTAQKAITKALKGETLGKAEIEIVKGALGLVGEFRGTIAAEVAADRQSTNEQRKVVREGIANIERADDVRQHLGSVPFDAQAYAGQAEAAFEADDLPSYSDQMEAAAVFYAQDAGVTDEIISELELRYSDTNQYIAALYRAAGQVENAGQGKDSENGSKAALAQGAGRGHGRSEADSGKPGNGRRDTAGRAERKHTTEPLFGSETDELLTDYTEEDLQKQAKEKAAREKAEADKQAKAEAKNKADSEAVSFQLTGSDRKADSNPAQVDLLDAVEQEESKSIDEAAHEAATSPKNDLPEPTEAQKEAGNYKVGRLKVHGLDISIENPKGSKRSGTAPDGKRWENTMGAHYGYIRKTEGADGDHVDVFVGDSPESESVWIIDQVDPNTGKFDEVKILLGFKNKIKARSSYMSSYMRGWKGIGTMHSLSVSELKGWLKNGDTTKAYKATGTRNEVSSGVSGVAPDERAVSKPRQQEVPSVRSERDNSMREVGEQLSGVSRRHGTQTGKENELGADRQQQGVRAGERSVGDAERAGSQPKGQSVDRTQREADVDGGLGNGDRNSTLRDKESNSKLQLEPNKGNHNSGERAKIDVQNVDASRDYNADGGLGKKIRDEKGDFRQQNNNSGVEHEKGVRDAGQNESLSPPPDKPKAKRTKAPSEEGVSVSGDQQAIKDFGEKIGGARKDTATRSTQKKSARSDDESKIPAWRRRFEVSEAVSSSRVENIGRWFIRDTRSKDAYGQPKQMGDRRGYASKEEAESMIPLIAVAIKHSVYSNRDGSYAVWRNISDRKRVQVVEQTFESRNDALEYMAAHANEIIETNTTFGEADLPKPPSTVRKGVARREGNIKDSDFSKVFGFRGVEFGNWNNQEERQELLNDAYDGLLDLAEVLDVPPKAISLGGELALAFGARGQGLSGARAHYEPARVVINLTKENGAGSLAHEWFHALDHYLSRLDGKASATWKTNDDGTRTLKISRDNNANFASSGMSGERSGMRVELRDAYRDLMHTMIRKAEKYVEDTKKADDFVGRARKVVEDELAGIRRNLADTLDPKYYKRKNNPASTEQLAEFDTIAEKIISGASLKTEFKQNEKSRGYNGRHTNEGLERINDILKDVRGRQGFNAERRGPLDRLRTAMSYYESRLNVLADAKSGDEKIKTIATDFLMNAKELDQGRGSDYWTEPYEMAARAFQGYVEDRIAESGGRSPFLNYGPENAAIITGWGLKRPFPYGEERKAINKAFDRLVEVLQHKETEDGTVVLFSKSATLAEDKKPKGMEVQRVQQITETFLAKFKGAGTDEIDVRIHRDHEDAFGREIARELERKKHTIKGGFDPKNNRLILVAANLASYQDTIDTLQHEILVHKGLGLFAPDVRQRIISAVLEAAPQSPSLKPIWARVLVDYKDDSETIKAEEVIAAIAERRLSALDRFINKMLIAFRKALAAIGWTKPGLGNRDLLEMIYKIGDAFMEGKQAAPRDDLIERVDSRSTSTQSAYEQRIDELFSGDKASSDGVRILDRSDVLDLLGYGDLPVHVAESKVVAGQQNHHLKAADWKKIPEWLENPIAVFDSDTVSGRLVFIAPELLNGAPVIMAVEPNTKMGRTDVHLLVNAYDKDRGGMPVGRWVRDGLLRYMDKKQSRAFGTTSGLQLPEVVHQARGSGQRVYTGADLFKYRQTNGGTMYRRQRNAVGGSNGPFVVMEEEFTDRWIRILQDKFKPLKRTQAAIESASGPLTEEENAYMAEEAFHGKTEKDLSDIERDHIKPLVDAMVAHEVERTDLDLYLIAKHAQERNAYIASINPNMPDGGSGMTNAQALKVLATLRNEGRLGILETLADRVYAMTKARRELIREAGLQEDGQTDAWESMYDFYVPLKGFAANEINERTPRKGSGFDIRGKESMRALGRRSMAASPVLHAIQDLTESVIRKRKNEVGQTFLKMVENHPNEEYWQVFTDENPDMDRRIVKTADGEVVKSVPMPMHMMKDKYLAVKRDGKQYFIKLKDERLMNAMKNLGPENNKLIVRHLGAMTRFLSSVNTRYNPEFVISNMARDIQTAIYNALAEQDIQGGKVEGKALALKMVKGVPAAIRAIYASDRGKTLSGDAAKVQQFYEEYLQDGAKTGYFDSKDIDGLAKDLQRMIRIAKGDAWGSVLKYKKIVGDFVEHGNNAIENGVRLSAYMEARKQGVSRKMAASFAKNLTVNFNRRGEVGTALTSVYMFANASIQGTANFVRTIGTLGKDVNGKRKLNNAQKAAAAMVAASFALSILNRMMGGEDDDGVEYWDKVPDYVRERNIVIMKSVFGGAPGEYWTIPAPYGYNVFHNLGDTIEATIYSKYQPRRDGLLWGTVMSAINSFSPVGAHGGDTETALFLTLVPTVLKPLGEISTNTNHFGSEIYRENEDHGPQKADSALWQRTTKSGYKAVSEFMNEVTGGSDYRSGFVDISPDTLEHITEFTLGGIYRLGTGLYESGSAIDEERTLDDKNIPFYRKISGEVKPHADQSRFRDALQEIKNVHAEFETLKGKERFEFRKENLRAFRLEAYMENQEKMLKALRKRRNAIESMDDISEKERDERLRDIEARMKRIWDRANKKWDAAA